jgi:putative hydrolase of the HAD superfamily
VDFHAESLALAQAVITTPTPDDDHHAHAARLHNAGSVIWGRSRDHQQSATIADLFTEAGLEHDEELLQAYFDFWQPHTPTDPQVRPLWEWLHNQGIKVGGALQHDLAARVARRFLRARRGLRPGRR